MLYGLLTPTQGAVHLPTRVHTATRKKAFMFQHPMILRSKTLLSNITHTLKERSKKDAVHYAQQALAWIGLETLAQQSAMQLSLGQQQKLCLARCWAQQANIIFLDEPTASLDPDTTKRVEEAINALHAEQAKILISTHDMQQVKRIASDVVFIHHGKIYYFADIETFFADQRVRASYLLW